MMIIPPQSFEPDFASPAEWATVYRACGLQVVPAHMPNPAVSWKFPALREWGIFQDELVPDAQFERWYGVSGEYSNRVNMGVLTGRASGNLMVVDLDEYKTSSALSWWNGMMALHNNASEIETCQQITGGGGRQILFHTPEDWVVPTNKTTIGIDIRGQGGFAMFPPSQHVSGTAYAWKPGCAPWECEIATAPTWMLDEVTELVQRFGGTPSRIAGGAHTVSPEAQYTVFGMQIDGRETYMRDLVWATVIDMRKECPIPPSEGQSQAKMTDTYNFYENKVKSRLQMSGTNAELLEREDRGLSMFTDKWRRAMKKWHNEIKEEAAKERPDRPAIASEPASFAMPTLAEPAATLVIDPETGKPNPLLLSAAQFVAKFTPPEYLVDGILQRGYLYSMTARTGHGKTAVAMYLAQCIARSLPFHGRTVLKGTVLLLAGENPDDIRARFLVLADENKFDPEKLKMKFLDGRASLTQEMPRIWAETAGIDDLVLVIVDTAAAYFTGDDTNNNHQQGDYARLLRQLTFMRGKPAVLVNCHPIKNATKDNLVPMGGSAFLNEIDGNLTLWAGAEKQTTLHWQGKFRGPEFESLPFEMKVATSVKVIDSHGQLMPSVVAEPISELKLTFAENTQTEDLIKLLKFIAMNKRASISELAVKCNFVTSEGKPQKSKVFRLGEKLMRAGYVVRNEITSKYVATPKGKKQLDGDDEDEG